MVLADVRLLNPFLRGALYVLDSMGIPAERQGPVSVESTDETTEAVTVIVPIAGAMGGGVFYGFDQSTAQRVAGRMLGELGSVRWDDHLLASALGEFGNMVSGHAAAALEEAGIRCSIAPPIVASHSRLIVAKQPFDRLVVCITTPLGSMKIHLALHNAAASD